MTFGFLDFIRRSNPVVSSQAALGVRSVVWARFRAGEFEDQNERPWIKMIWSVAGEGGVRLSGRVHRLPPDRVAVLFPGMRHEAWAVAPVWEARWVTLDGSLCAAFAQAVGVRRAGIYAPRCDLAEIFARLREGLFAATPQGQRAAELAAHELLANLGSSPSAGKIAVDPVIDEVLALFRRRWAQADFGIAQLAAQIGIHRSVLSRRFRATVGVSPLQHLMDLRMGHALTLLRASDLSIREVAFQCGFSDPGYFARLFRRTQGSSPKEYRLEKD